MEEKESFVDIRLMREVVQNLLEDRDFRSYELSYVNGCMDEEQFEEIASEWQGKRKHWDKNELKESVDCLKEIFPDLDCGKVTVMLCCSLEEAIETLK